MELGVFIALSIKYDSCVCLVDGTLFWYREERGWKRGKYQIPWLSTNSANVMDVERSNVALECSNPGSSGPKRAETSNIWTCSMNSRTYEFLRPELKTQGVERSNVQCPWAIYFSLQLFWLGIILGIMVSCMGLHMDLITLIIYLDFV